MSELQGDLQDLYRELILDHSRNPRHFGRLSDATHTADGINPLCGDKLKLYLRIDDTGRIESSSFEGSGCAISVASASLMTDTVTGLPVDQAENCFEAITRRLTDDVAASSPDSGLDKLRALDGVRAYPARVKCATLAWHALHAALINETTPTSTE
jgi:nitrogen fixation protein NifU and related proteins